MKFEDLLQSNIEGKKEQEKCGKDKEGGHDLDDVRIIYRRCKKCGKFVAVPDPEHIMKRGESGRG